MPETDTQGRRRNIEGNQVNTSQLRNIKNNLKPPKETEKSLLAIIKKSLVIKDDYRQVEIYFDTYIWDVTCDGLGRVACMYI